MRWSALRKILEQLRVPELDLKIHCTAFRRADAESLGRYTVLLNGRTILEIPTNFDDLMKSREQNSDVSIVTNILRWWIDLPREELLHALHADDRWGLVDVLRISDRRLGKRSLVALNQALLSPAAALVWAARFGQVHRPD